MCIIKYRKYATILFTKLFYVKKINKKSSRHALSSYLIEMIIFLSAAQY